MYGGYTCTSIALELTHMVVKSCQSLVKATAPCDIASQRIQELLKAYFKLKKTMVSKKRFHYLCEGGIEKSVPQDHRLSSLGKPRDAKR